MTAHITEYIIQVYSFMFLWAVSSMVERYIHIVEAIGSNPIPPTKISQSGKVLYNITDGAEYFFSIYRMAIC